MKKDIQTMTIEELQNLCMEQHREIEELKSTRDLYESLWRKAQDKYDILSYAVKGAVKLIETIE